MWRPGKSDIQTAQMSSGLEYSGDSAGTRTLASQPLPLLLNKAENGLILVLHEARAGEYGPPLKLCDSAQAVAVATVEAFWCWCEATVAHYASLVVLRAAAELLQGPRTRRCHLDQNGTGALVHCVMVRDWPIVAARAGAVLCMTWWLSWRCSSFFGRPTRTVGPLHLFLPVFPSNMS